MTAIAGAATSSVSGHQLLVTDKYKMVKATITFGNGTLTYPSGGISVSPTLFPFSRSTIRSLIIIDASNGDGFVYKWDDTNNKIRIYQAPSSGPGALVEFTTSATPAATSIVVEVLGE